MEDGELYNAVVERTAQLVAGRIQRNDLEFGSLLYNFTTIAKLF